MGKVTAAKLKEVGIENGADLKHLGEERLRSLLGKHGGQLYRFVLGQDDRPVEPTRERKSLGKEVTFERDLVDRGRMEEALEHLARQVEDRLVELDLYGRTLTLKLRWSDFQLLTRSISRPNGFQDAQTMIPLLRMLLVQLDGRHRAVRLLGVSVSHLLSKEEMQRSRVPFTTHDLATWAENVRQDCLAAFRTRFEGKALFAYLTDLHGNYQLYHDANDLPTIYAPVWGFCHPHDEAWDQTLQFALSTQNKGGFYPGVFGGLGSVHTPHPWPLGDVQELLYAQVLGDQERWQRVLQKLKRVVQWDGLFSEAINEETGQVESRHWFSWPGAFLSTVLLLLGNR